MRNSNHVVPYSLSNSDIYKVVWLWIDSGL